MDYSYIVVLTRLVSKGSDYFFTDCTLLLNYNWNLCEKNEGAEQKVIRRPAVRMLFG